MQGPKGKLTTKLSNKREMAVARGCKMLALNTEHFYATEFFIGLLACLDFEGWFFLFLFFFFKFDSD